MLIYAELSWLRLFLLKLIGDIEKNSDHKRNSSQFSLLIYL